MQSTVLCTVIQSYKLHNTIHTAPPSFEVDPRHLQYATVLPGKKSDVFWVFAFFFENRKFKRDVPGRLRPVDSSCGRRGVPFDLAAAPRLQHFDYASARRELNEARECKLRLTRFC